MMISRRGALLGALATPVLAQAQQAEEWPSRSVSIVVQFGPGGSNDQVSRLVGQALGAKLGQPFIVNNRPGGSGAVAFEYVQRARPDGYTFLVGSYGATAVAPAVFQPPPFDPLKDLVPVCSIGAFPLVLVVKQDSPIRSVRDLVAFMKANPEKATVSGTSAVFQMTAALFDQRTGTSSTYVAYRSGAEATQAVATGDVLYSFVDSAAVVGPVDARLVRPIAVTSAARIPQWPEAQTMAEAGVQNIVVVLWNGFFAPLSTPEPILLKLQRATTEVVHSAEMEQRFRAITVEPMGHPADEFRGIVARDITLWREVAQRGNIRLER